MSAPKFTAGPWVARPYSIRDGRHIRFEIIKQESNGEEYIVARTPDDGSRTGEATAHLLAAAPELYAACKAALACPELNWQEMDDVSRGAVESLRAAIAKAEGGTV